MNDTLLKKLSKVKIVVSDVDGILTDGTIIVSKGQEYKTFHVEDALGTSLLKLSNIPISFISALPPFFFQPRSSNQKLMPFKTSRGGKVD